MKLVNKNYEFEDFLAIGYDTVANCNHECEEYGICRCTIKNNVCFDKFNDLELKDHILDLLCKDLSKEEKRNVFIDDLLCNGVSQIREYFIDRVLKINNCYDPENWEIEVSGGYYGEEIHGVYLSILDRVNSDLGQYTGDINKDIPFLLEREYGGLNHRLVGKKWKEGIVKMDDIIFPQTQHYNKVDGNLYYYKDEYYPFPRGVVLQDEKKYKVIDGYHRLKNTNQSNVIVYICY